MIRILASIMKNKLGLVQYPSFISFFVTWRCNCKCMMCDIWQKRTENELNLDELEQIFGQLKPVDVVNISGGEPFLRKDLADIVNIIDNKVSPKMIHLTTNGLLTDNIINTLKHIKAIKKIHLKVSIDAVGKDHDKIRGVLGAYDKAITTIEKASKLKSKLHFYLGVNQTIINEKGLKSYFKLKSILRKFNVDIHTTIAYDQLTTALYSNKGGIGNSDALYDPSKHFSKDKLIKFTKILLKDSSSLSNFEEKVIKKYYLRGLYNRLVKNKNKPNPKCVAINSHLRILPNGDIPICMYNSTIVGNLKKNRFRDIWFNEKMKQHRLWVKTCKGCWVGCESNVNAIYSGDIWKGFL